MDTRPASAATGVSAVAVSGKKIRVALLGDGCVELFFGVGTDPNQALITRLAKMARGFDTFILMVAAQARQGNNVPSGPEFSENTRYYKTISHIHAQVKETIRGNTTCLLDPHLLTNIFCETNPGNDFSDISSKDINPFVEDSSGLLIVLGQILHLVKRYPNPKNEIHVDLIGRDSDALSNLSDFWNIYANSALIPQSVTLCFCQYKKEEGANITLEENAYLLVPGRGAVKDADPRFIKDIVYLLKSDIAFPPRDQSWSNILKEPTVRSSVNVIEFVGQHDPERKNLKQLLEKRYHPFKLPLAHVKIGFESIAECLGVVSYDSSIIAEHNARIMENFQGIVLQYKALLPRANDADRRVLSNYHQNVLELLQEWETHSKARLRARICFEMLQKQLEEIKIKLEQQQLLQMVANNVGQNADEICREVIALVGTLTQTLVDTLARYKRLMEYCHNFANTLYETMQTLENEMRRVQQAILSSPTVSPNCSHAISPVLVATSASTSPTLFASSSQGNVSTVAVQHPILKHNLM